MTATIIANAQQGDTMDLLCWRELGTTSGGVVEQALALNQNLSAGGPVLPTMVDILLPAITAAQAPTLETVTLWD